MGGYLVFMSVDRFLSASTARPPILHEEDCDLFYPSEDTGAIVDRFYTETLDGSRMAIMKHEKTQQGPMVSVTIQARNEDTLHTPLSSYAVMCQGIAIMGRVTIFINRGNRKPKSATAYQPDSVCAKLDREIDAWQENLPNHLKDTPSNFETFKSAQGDTAQFLGQRFLLVSSLHE